MLKVIKFTALVGALGGSLAACESSDVPRAALGGVGGYAADRALGGDGTIGAAAGIAAGTVCDDVTPGVCR
ncbi:hypothetical protein [Roseivivax sediminis]|uniref:17 kDa surface antigen n=1 Tax=Roseivivax sediminis TaxID=936889 RepID=A0A1I1X1B7_9RHOB|nr:hypothetical protein [Roseivivax sediminis]SFE01147.1 hypothetical protein SAMN04515678_105193 [Roseivivax sediminis]